MLQWNENRLRRVNKPINNNLKIDYEKQDKEPLIKSSNCTVLASDSILMEVAMRQITFACQPSFEKHARPSRREQILLTMESVVPGESWKR